MELIHCLKMEPYLNVIDYRIYTSLHLVTTCAENDGKKPKK